MGLMTFLIEIRTPTVFTTERDNVKNYLNQDGKIEDTDSEGED